MTKPNESDYTSHVAYTRALEEYCKGLEAENKALRELLAEATTDAEYYAQYAGE